MITKYYMTWHYDKHLQQRNRHKLYEIYRIGGLGDVRIASFRSKRDAESYLKYKNEDNVK